MTVITAAQSASHICFVDEAGDEGIKRGSRYFAVGAIVVAKADLATVEADFGTAPGDLTTQPKDAGHFRKLSHSAVKAIRAVQHDQSTGLQIADVAISGIYQAFEPDPHGSCEDSYVKALAPRLYGAGGNVLGNGLKLMGKKIVVDELVAKELGWI